MSVFLQSRYLCDDVPLDGFTQWARLRIAAERLWVRRRLRADMRVLVQTPSMRQAVRRSLGTEAVIMPFASLPPAPRPGPRTVPAGRARLLYPASGEPHKNHGVLLAAWRILQQAGVDAELHLTVDGPADVTEAIAQAQAAGVSVVNHGHLDPSRMAALYHTSTALIFPSHVESFGLPLLEAQAAGLPIVASELDYVRDVVRPAETFDPTSAVSIARAVQRFLGAPEKQVALLTAAHFIRRVVSGRE